MLEAVSGVLLLKADKASLQEGQVGWWCAAVLTAHRNGKRKSLCVTPCEAGSLSLNVNSYKCKPVHVYDNVAGTD
jgi:hypothetical protein